MIRYNIMSLQNILHDKWLKAHISRMRFLWRFHCFLHPKKSDCFLLKFQAFVLVFAGERKRHQWGVVS